MLGKKNYKFQIGYHSNFDFVCNTERDFKESLSIALGLESQYVLLALLRTKITI